MTRRQTENVIACLGAVTAAGAAGGSIYGLRGAPGFPREWLEGSPFRDHRVPSLILGVVVGGSSAASAVAARRDTDHAGVLAVGAGAILTGWIVAQLAMIGPRSFLQPLMGAVGVTMIVLGTKLNRGSHS
ncbi:MAG: hypothetical protein ACXVEW_00255 [Solirubrobacteraceae bacterium]